MEYDTRPSATTTKKGVAIGVLLSARQRYVSSRGPFQIARRFINRDEINGSLIMQLCTLIRREREREGGKFCQIFKSRTTVSFF